MRLRRFGVAGRPIVYVPSSGGDETEFERYGMHEAAARWIEGRRAQIFAIDGRAPDTLWNDGIPPSERIRRYAAFERYVALEVLTWIEQQAPGSRPIVVGTSYGAFVAANLLFKHPSRVDLACGLGGVYGMWHRLDGYHDDEVYLHTPLEYLPRLEAPTILEEIRATRGLMMFAAENDEWRDSTRDMADVCSKKGLPHAVDLWAAPANHHERWWVLQLRSFLERYGDAPEK